jgi:two-component system response regulator RegA
MLVDDDDRLRGRLAIALEDRAFRVIQADSVAAALALVSSAPTHAVLDLKMPGGSGLTLIEPLLKALPELRIVVLTGYGSIATTVDAIRLGAVNYLAKPADADMVLAAFVRGDDAPLALAPEYEPPSLARAEWEHIQRVLDDCGGNITKAAQKLGLHRRTLQRKLQTWPPNR